MKLERETGNIKTAFQCLSIHYFYALRIYIDALKLVVLLTCDQAFFFSEERERKATRDSAVSLLTDEKM